MAEVFGVVSGAVGTAGVAVQFAESIRKIYLFCKDVHDAPEQLRRAADELQLLSHILDSMAIQLQRTPLAYDGHVSLPVILHSCRQGQEEMSALLNNLQKNVSKKRGAVRMVLKSTEIKKHLEKIERAKTALQIAQNIYHGHFVQQVFGFVSTRFDQLEQQTLGSFATGFKRLESIVVASMRPVSTDTHMDGTCKHDQSRAIPLTGKREGYAQSHTSIDTTSTSRRRRLAHCTRIKLQPLPWLWNQTWDLAVQRAFGRWDFSFSTYRTISSKSPFFQACQVADVSGIQRMLSARTAFPSDRDEEGHTALHYLANAFNKNSEGRSASQTNLNNNDFTKAIGILISEGADVCISNSRRCLPLHLLGMFYDSMDEPVTICWTNTSDCSAEIELVRALTYSLEFDIEERDNTLLLIDFFRNAGPETIKLLQTKMHPPWTEIPFSERVSRLAASESLILSSQVDSFLAWLGIDDTKALWSSCTAETRDRLLMLTFKSLCEEAGTRRLESVKEWHKLILGYKPFATEFNPHRSSDLRSIHARLLWCYDTDTNINKRSRVSSQLNIAQRYLTFLVSELNALGVALAEFGNVESGKWQICDEDGNYTVEIWIYDDDEDTWAAIHMIGFDHGPKIEDWRAWVSTPFHEWAGEFWRGLEHPRKTRRNIPGAFPNDDSDECSDHYSDGYSDEYSDEEEE